MTRDDDDAAALLSRPKGRRSSGFKLVRLEERICEITEAAVDVVVDIWV
jgi:hypothetical protein